MDKDFESYCKEQFRSFRKTSSGEFEKSLSYSFFSGGKRIRPALIFSLGKDLGLKRSDLEPAATAIELVHTYSLIHDDLPAMDNDTYRRGRLSHHAKYGEASAVLAGDGLLTFAFQVLAENYSGEVLKNLVILLSKTAGSAGMIGGQVLDCLTTKRDVEIFNQIHLLKTGMLFKFCTETCGHIAGFKKNDLIKLSELGLEMGLLFQLQDDLFDKDKADERAEENILSVLSEVDLLSLIEKKKGRVLEIFKDFDLGEQSNLYKLLEKLFVRDH